MPRTEKKTFEAIKKGLKHCNHPLKKCKTVIIKETIYSKCGLCGKVFSDTRLLG